MTTITMDQKRTFVVEYTQKVFRNRFQKLFKGMPTRYEVNKKMGGYIESGLAKYKKSDEYNAAFFQQHIPLDIANKGICNDMNFISSDVLVRVVEQMYGNRITWGEARGLERALMQDYPLRTLETHRAFLTVPVGLLNLRGYREEVLWPVVWKHAKDENGDRIEDEGEWVVRDVYCNIMAPSWCSKMLALHLKVVDHVEETNALIEEAGKFATDLWQVLKPMRSLKKLETEWEELLPEFYQITGASNNTGKALLPAADTKNLLTQISTYKEGK